MDDWAIKKLYEESRAATVLLSTLESAYFSLQNRRLAAKHMESSMAEVWDSEDKNILDKIQKYKRKDY